MENRVKQERTTSLSLIDAHITISPLIDISIPPHIDYLPRGALYVLLIED